MVKDAALPLGLPIRVHLKVKEPPSESLLADPSKLTTVPTTTFWLVPGLDVGATFVVAVASVPPPQPDREAQSAKTPMKARNGLRKLSL